MNKILPILLIVIMTFVAYGVYKQANKSIKTKRIECQSKTTTFEKINIEFNHVFRSLFGAAVFYFLLRNRISF